ncbi:MAG: DUF4911 domain-containing protein [Deltaproteobacteria bacterium]|nr:DUF4911 domain-containing protein [Deltaproteobacteria bacterium]MBW2015339.1 DUF4911 domain-containing protein [Deltaproteobacteria bacterium]MBW2128200.1 DUF4911 domain-containing protein [Deltaproteobacteria bacterium]
MMETVRRYYRVDRKDIHYIRYTIESYDGAAVVRTIDPQEALLEILIAPGCEDLIGRLVEDLSGREGLQLKSIDSPGHKSPEPE